MTHFERDKDTPIIISNNCWGYHYYQNNNIPYPTPFIGLYLYAPDYINMVENFDEYINTEIRFTKSSKWPVKFKNYPIGLLKNAEIHFLHYKTENEAKDKWNRRLSRMHKNYDRYYFKFDDVEKPFDDALLRRFHTLPFKNKISFTSKRHPEFENNFEFYLDKPLSGGRLYQVTPFYMNVNSWISGKELRKHFHYTLYQKTLSHLFNN